MTPFLNIQRTDLLPDYSLLFLLIVGIIPSLSLIIFAWNLAHIHLSRKEHKWVKYKNMLKMSSFLKSNIWLEHTTW